MHRETGPVDERGREAAYWSQMQLSGKNKASAKRRLSDLPKGQEAVLQHIDLPHDLAHRLMELGFIPGMRIAAGHSAPSGDPRVFRVDGTEIALRRETAQHLYIDELHRQPS
jgi:ferrous iron transport protein A